MGREAISSVKLTNTLTLSEQHRYHDTPRGFWLYDYTRKMNLAMGEPTPEDAFVKALMYYQERLLTVENELKELRTNVDTFISQVNPPNNNEEDYY